VNAPKPAKSAYIYFCDSKRPELKKTSPDLTFGEVGKKLGEMWKELGIYIYKGTCTPYLTAYYYLHVILEYSFFF
jgi:hypothetical protein